MRLVNLAIATCLMLGCAKPKADFSAFELHEAYCQLRKADERYQGKSIVAAASGDGSRLPFFCLLR